MKKLFSMTLALSILITIVSFHLAIYYFAGETAGRWASLGLIWLLISLAHGIGFVVAYVD